MILNFRPQRVALFQVRSFKPVPIGFLKIPSPKKFREKHSMIQKAAGSARVCQHSEFATILIRSNASVFQRRQQHGWT